MNRPIQIANDDSSFETLFELSPAPMLVHRTDTQALLAANKAALALFGMAHEVLLDVPLHALQHPAYARSGDAPDDSAHNAADKGIWCHQHKSGEILYLECASRAVTFHGDEAVLNVLRDVTVERRAIRVMETSERRFRDLFEHTLGFICTHDLEGVLLSANPAATAALGYSVGELLGNPLGDLMPDAQRERFSDYLQRLRDRGSDRGQLVVCHRDGGLRTWQYRNRLFEDADGTVSVIASAQDITELRAAEESVRRSEQQLRMITDVLPLRVAYVDAQMRFVFVNGLYERLYGRHRDQIVGKRLDEILDGETPAARLPYLQRALNGQRQQFEAIRDDPRGPQCDEITFLPDFAADGHSVVGVFVTAQDITAQRQEERRLVKLAQIDSLTGLLNRSGLVDRLQRALERSHDQESSLAVLYMDLDRFKQVNDAYGHGVGDWVLQTVAKRLQNAARSSDALGRLGGDEFVLVMEGVPDREPVVQMAQRIIDGMLQPFAAAEGKAIPPIQLGASLGVAMHTKGREEAAALLERADEALYEAKRGGRGTWRMAGK